MITALILSFAFLFSNSNPLLLAIAVILCGGICWRDQMEVPQRLFILWLLWAFLGSCLSGNYLVSLIGCKLRMEGWLFWFLCFAAARLIAGNLRGRMEFSVSMLNLLIIWALLHFTGWWKLPILLDASFGVGIAAVMSGFHPIGAVFGILPIAVSGFRSALLAILAVLAVNVALGKDSLHKIGLIVGVIILIVIGASKVGTRLKTMEIDRMGVGTRPQLILQADRIMRGDAAMRKVSAVETVVENGQHYYVMRGRFDDMPKRRIFTGIGLDMGLYYFSQGIGPTQSPSDMPDRAHNILLDIATQTGWIGYVLALCCFASCIHLVWYHRTKNNVMFLSIIAGWIVLGMFNPQGEFLHLMMVTAVCGINSKEEKDE